MLPKYVTIDYVRDRWVVFADPLVVHETIFQYQLVAWLSSNGYEPTATETWTRGPKVCFITSYNGLWGVYPEWAEHPDDAWSWHETKQQAVGWALAAGFRVEESDAQGVDR